MTYTADKVEGQTLMFVITTEHNGTEITFSVVCANDESEIPDLVAYHLDFLDAPTIVSASPAQNQAEEKNLSQRQSDLISALEARIAALEATS